MEKNYILHQEDAARKMRRMAYEILEHNADEKELVLVGILDHGAVIAKAIAGILQEIAPFHIELLTLSLDKKKPREVQLSKPVPVDDKVVIIVDDVANSGKTLLYATRPFLEHHPKKIQTLVLVERTHKAFAVKPDYVGLSVATTLPEHIYVEVSGSTVKGAWLE